MDIRRLTTETVDWDSFVRSTPGGSPFHLLAWKQALYDDGLHPLPGEYAERSLDFLRIARLHSDDGKAGLPGGVLDPRLYRTIRRAIRVAEKRNVRRARHNRRQQLQLLRSGVIRGTC